MRTLLAIIAALLTLSGCATREGIALPTTRPSKDDVADFNKRNDPAQIPAPTVGPAPVASREPVKSMLIPEPEGAKVIIVGNVMAFEAFDAAVLNQRYDVYLKRMTDASKQPNFSREWYSATSAGETSVKFSGVTGLYSRFYRAEVPNDIAKSINFSSSFGTFMVGSSGDLVAAQISPRTGTWVTHVLCSEKDPAFSACESQYKVGVYQGVDGRQIDDKLQVVTGGTQIDTVTFKKR